MRSQKKIKQEHLKNKLVRREKARLRKRLKKNKKPRYILMTITGLENTVIEKLRRLAKETHKSVNKLVREILDEEVKKFNDGI